MSYRASPASRPAYSFDAVTREFIGAIEVFLSPADGSYPLPANAVDIAPPQVGVFEKAVLNADGSAWEVMQDYRGVMLYDTTTALAVANTLALGERLPKTVTTTHPIRFAPQEYLRNHWDATRGTWQSIPDYSQAALYDKATGQLVDPLPVGQALPVELTTISPPRKHDGSVVFDAVKQQWLLKSQNGS